MTTVCYTTREEIKRALNLHETSISDGQVDRANASASQDVEGLLNRVFYPVVQTKYFPWPDREMNYPWRLWLDDDTLIAATAVACAGTTIPSGNYYLEPVNSGPPYSRIEINLGSQSAFGAGTTRQRSIAVTGTWGYTADETPAGALAAAVTDTTGTTWTVTDGSLVGVGSLLHVDSERVIVTGRAMTTTAQTLQTDLTALASNVAVAVTTGSAYHPGEVLQLDTERMLIDSVTGNTLTVRRGWDGTVLATHTGSTIYASRALTVQRGVLGTTAATHSNAATVTAALYPGTIRALTVAEAVNTLLQEQTGYARTAGSGDAIRQMRLDAILDLRGRAQRDYGRQARTRVV